MLRVRDGMGGCGVGLGKGFLIDPVLCKTCFYETRKRLGLDASLLDRLVGDGLGRTRLFVESYRMLGRDLFAEKRRELNNAALRYVDMARPWRWRLEELLRAAALANSVDVWTPWHDGDEGLVFEGRVVDRGLDEAVSLLRRAQRIAFLLDNAGEAVIDVVLAAVLSARGSGRAVVLVARGEPYETDVVVDEVVPIVVHVLQRMGAHAPLMIAGTGSAYPAPATPHVSEAVRRILREADAVVAKGVANLEALMEYCSVDPAKTIVLFRAKCPPLARLYRVERGDAIVSRGYMCMGNS